MEMRHMTASDERYIFGQSARAFDLRFMMERMKRIFSAHDPSMYELGSALRPMLLGIWLMSFDLIAEFPSFFLPLSKLHMPVWILGIALFGMGTIQVWAVLVNYGNVRKWAALGGSLTWAWLAWVFFLVTPTSFAVPLDLIFVAENLCMFWRAQPGT